MTCPRASDRCFGPRVNPLCRSFDFTLLFEDTLFTIVPASLFIAAAAVRLSVLARTSVKVTSSSLAVSKLVS